MRSHCLTACLVMSFFAPLAHADEEDLPYTAYVVADQVQVRSGPGENYYPVLKMHRGDAVEVYRHDPGGWYAIRPPEGSFSWVSAEFVELEDDRVGLISGERVLSRVGSDFSDVRDVIQVRLDQGEAVEVLESQRFGTGPGAKTWYKIQPPAGEFRWIAGKYLTDDPPKAKKKRKSANNNLLIARMSRNRDRDDSEVRDPDRDEPSTRTAEYEEEVDSTADEDRSEDLEDGDSKSRSTGMRTRRDDDQGWSRRTKARSESDDETEETDDVEESSTGRRKSRFSKTDLALQLEDMDLELAEIVAKERDKWDFRDLEERVLEAKRHADTALERGLAQKLLKKIDRFGGIQEQMEEVDSGLAEREERPNTMVDGNVRRIDYEEEISERNDGEVEAAESRRDIAEDEDKEAVAGRYDGLGILTAVVTQKVDSPRYALVRRDGTVACYVNPAPGVNARRYLDQRVGVVGTKGYLPDLQAKVVMAKRFELIDERR